MRKCALHFFIFQRSGKKRHEDGELYRLASCWYSSSSLPVFYVSVFYIGKKKKSKIPLVFLYDSACVMSGSEYGDGTNVERERTTRHIWLMNFGRVSGSHRGSFCVNGVGRQLHFFFFFVGWRCAPLVILSVCFTDPAVASSFVLWTGGVQQSRGIIKPQGITSITAAKDFWLVVSLLFLSHTNDYKVNDTHF